MPQFFRILLSLCLIAATPAGAAQHHPVKEIRKVVVSGDASAPPTVLKRAGEALRNAARATRRPVRLERAQMEVFVSAVVLAADGRNSARVAVALTGPAGGAGARSTFTVNSFMPQRKGRETALAEAIATRVALAYNLAPVKVVKARGKRPGKGRKEVRHQAHRPAEARADDRPLVIPTEAALTVRSRARPAGSKEKIAPCVVTPTVSCD